MAEHTASVCREFLHVLPRNPWLQCFVLLLSTAVERHVHRSRASSNQVGMTIVSICADVTIQCF